MLAALQRWTPAWLLCGLGLLLAVLILGLESLRTRAILMGCATVGFWALAALGALHRAGQEIEASPAWRTLAGAFALAGTFNVLATLGALRGAPEAPPPAPVVLVTWAAIALFAAAWLRFQPELYRSRHWGGFLLDGGSFLASFLLAYWLIFLRNLFGSGPFPLLDRVATLGLVLGIVGMAGLLGRTAAELEGGATSALGFLGLGALVMALNLPLLEALLERRVFLGHASQVGMIPAWILFITASRRPLPTARSTRRIAGLLYRDLYPYTPLAVALPVLVHSAILHRERLDPLALGLLVVLLACLAARQLLTLRQVREANRTLETRVEARTRELSETQACLVRTERMNVLATLGAGVAHDINNLMGAAKAYADLILEETPDLPQPARLDLERLCSSLDKAGQLTRRMLGFGRESTGPLSFCALDRLESLAPVLRALVPRRIDLQVRREEGRFPLLGDPHAFDQVLVNLVGNARDAIPGSGWIRVRAERADGLLRLEVADSGSGIPEAIRGRIFEPFFSTKPAGQGTGLGLSSLKVIVEGFGGSIEVESAEGEGSTFRVLVPPSPGGT